MTDTQVPEDFGQAAAPHQLSAMARGIASGLQGGRPAPWAGFVWYRPEGLFQQNLIRRAWKPSRQQAA